MASARSRSSKSTIRRSEGTKKAGTKKSSAKTKPKKARRSSTRPRSGRGAAGTDVGAKAHAIVHRALTKGTVDASDVRRAVSESVSALRSKVAQAVPSERENVLRQLVDGMAEAVAASATAAGDSFRKAAAAGQRMTVGEWNRFSRSMASLEDDFIAALSSAGKELQHDSRVCLEHVVRATKKAGTAIAPAARDATNVALRHAPELALESMKAGGRMAAGVAGEFAKGISGVMSGFADALRGVAQPPKRSAGAGKTRSKRR